MVALADVLKQGDMASEDAPVPDPKTREDLLQWNGAHALVRTGDGQVLALMDPAVRGYLEEVVTSARFVKEDGAYLVRLSWPALPQGWGGKIDVQVCDPQGTGLDGYVWVCRKGMEAVPTYRADLREAGNASFVFDLDGPEQAETVSLLVSVTAENGLSESCLALAEQDLRTGTQNVQYKLASDRYQISGTFPLDAPVFQWK